MSTWTSILWRATPPGGWRAGGRGSLLDLADVRVLIGRAHARERALGVLLGRVVAGEDDVVAPVERRVVVGLQDADGGAAVLRLLGGALGLLERGRGLDDDRVVAVGAGPAGIRRARGGPGRSGRRRRRHAGRRGCRRDGG